MEAPQFYRSVRVIPLAGETITVPGLGESATECLFAEPHIPVFSLGGVSDADDELVFDPNTEVTLRRISFGHGRSFELEIEGMEDIGAWEDEFGFLYTAFTIKGNSFDNPYVRPNNLSPTKYDAYGMQDEHFIKRTVVASEVLRRLGIETEQTTRVIKPSEMPYGGKVRSTKDFKALLLRKSSTPMQYMVSKIPILGRANASKRREIARYLEDAQFVFTVRAMQVPERISDLVKLNVFEEQFIETVQRAFDFVNFSEMLLSEKDPSHVPQHFDSHIDSDIERYLTTYLPAKLGRFFAKMHMNGLVHGFPHAGNISTVGSIYDLDSVKGPALGLGDSPVKSEEYWHDTANVLQAVIEELDMLDSLGLTQSQDSLALEPNLSEKFRSEFLNSYLASIDPKLVTNELGLALIKILDSYVDPEKASDYVENWLGQLVGESGGIDYKFGQTYEQVLEAYGNGLRRRIKAIRDHDSSTSRKKIKEIMIDSPQLEGFIDALVSTDFDSRYSIDPQSFIRQLFLFREIKKMQNQFVARENLIKLILIEEDLLSEFFGTNPTD